MSHEVETMAYAGQVPWHGLGTKVAADLTPRQMQKQAGLDWSVVKRPSFVTFDGDMIETGTNALLRESDNTVLSPSVGDGWEPVQNSEAFDFFNEFCLAGDMEMHTAGSLKNGQIVWVLAKIKESFDVLGEDRVDNYMLFSNPHQYGKSLNVRMTPTRVVCNNTLTMSLNGATNNEVKLNHRREFNADLVKDQMGLAHEKFEQYRDAARFMASKKAKFSDLITFYNEVFPAANTKKKEAKEYADLSTTAKTAFDVLETQPGADMAMGTWWNALNSVTFITDHKLGRSTDARMASAWFGINQTRKLKATNIALEMAEAA
jgi:phage/plasmid-like protein (TIGR03299 family)